MLSDWSFSESVSSSSRYQTAPGSRTEYNNRNGAVLARRHSRADHSHERNDAGTSCHQLDRFTLLRAPHEPAANRTSQFQTIVDRELLA